MAAAAALLMMVILEVIVLMEEMAGMAFILEVLQIQGITGPVVHLAGAAAAAAAKIVLLAAAAVAALTFQSPMIQPVTCQR